MLKYTMDDGHTAFKIKESETQFKVKCPVSVLVFGLGYDDFIQTSNLEAR